MSTTEGALKLWREIVRGLQAAGYAKAVPEYLKLSQALAQFRMTELLKGEAEAAHWAEIRQLATEALHSLGPLVEAARILAELPSELREGVSIAAAASSQPSHLEPQSPLSVAQASKQPLLPRKAPESAKADGVAASKLKSSSLRSGQSKIKSAVSKSKLSGQPRKAVNRAKRRKHAN